MLSILRIPEDVCIEDVVRYSKRDMNYFEKKELHDILFVRLTEVVLKE